MKVILEGSKLIWSHGDIREFRMCWNEGLSIPAIAERLDCKKLDVILLVLDQAESENIKPRNESIF